MAVNEHSILVSLGNLALTYGKLGRLDEALSRRQEVYSRTLKLCGEEHIESLMEAYNYSLALNRLKHFKESKALLREKMLVARRVLGEEHTLTLKIRDSYAEALYKDGGGTLDDLREVVTTLEDTVRIARRVLGGAHPLTKVIEHNLPKARAALRVREAPPPSSPSESV